MSKAEPTVQKYMTTQPYSIEPTKNLKEAQELMKKYNIRHLPVIADGKVAGILSDRDIKLTSGFEEVDIAEVSVADICVTKPYIVSPDSLLTEVAEEMASKHYGSAVVVQNSKLVGIFTTVDACRALVAEVRMRHHG